MGYFYLVFGLLLLGGGLFALIRTLRMYRKDKQRNSFQKEDIIWLGAGLGAIALSGIFLQLSVHVLSEFELDAGHQAMSLVGAFLFFLFFTSLWTGFYVRFYLPELVADQMKIAKIVLYSSIPLALGSFLLMMEGTADALTYPLACGFSINETGFHWLTAANVTDHSINSGFSIRWYGIIIVFGALVCYWVSDHKFYQKYGKHGILETCLLFAFPGGILGARIWYVVGNWEREGFNVDFAKVFQIWDGGLTILGGAVGGILCGVAYMLLRRKWVDIRYAMDTIVPTILLGQAIGRWGNFFNNEVYGQVVSLNQGWNWLPTWIANQMNYDGANQVFLQAGSIHVPLFLIESLLNIFGYFLIAYIIPAIWKKGRGLGVLSGLYLSWYGVVRIIMEPMRDTNFMMGTDNNWSIWNSLVYIILGVVLIAVFQTLWMIQKGKSWARGSLEEAEQAKAKAKSPSRVKKEEANKEEVALPPKFEIKEEEQQDNNE